MNLGFDHESNGNGGDRERSWERLYLDVQVGNENLLFSGLLRRWKATGKRRRFHYIMAFVFFGFVIFHIFL